MIVDVDPIAHVHAPAIDRQCLARRGLDDGERDELFGKLVGAVIVRAVGDDHRQAVGAVPRPRQMVGGSLAGGVGRIRVVARALGEAPLHAKGTIDLVGGDVDEPERRLRLSGEGTPMGQRRIEHGVGAHHVGLHEGARTVDGAVDVTLGGEVHDRLWHELRERRSHRSPVADVRLNQPIAAVGRHLFQRIRARGIGELVDVEHLVPELTHQHPHEGRTDESGAAGDQYAHQPFFRVASINERLRRTGRTPERPQAAALPYPLPTTPPRRAAPARRCPGPDRPSGCHGRARGCSRR